MTTPSPSRLVIQYTWSCSLNKVSEPRTDGQTLGAARPQKGKVVLCHDGWLRRHQGECAVPPRRPHRQSPSYRYIWPSGASLLCLWTSESGWLAREGGRRALFPLLCPLGNEGKWGEEGGGRVGRAAEASSTTDRAAQALTVEPWKRS